MTNGISGVAGNVAVPDPSAATATAVAGTPEPARSCRLAAALRQSLARTIKEPRKVSISSVLSPSALASQVLLKTPAGAVAGTAASFASTLLQALQQAGAPAGAAAATTTAGALHAHGHRHAHHGGGIAAQALLQNLQARAASAPGQLLNTSA